MSQPRRAVQIHGDDDSRVWIDLETIAYVGVPASTGPYAQPNGVIYLRAGTCLPLPRATVVRILDVLNLDSTHTWGK